MPRDVAQALTQHGFFCLAQGGAGVQARVEAAAVLEVATQAHQEVLCGHLHTALADNSGLAPLSVTL